MKKLGWLALGALAACSQRDSAAAERQFDLAMRSGTYSDACAAARRVADNWLQAGNQQEFEEWRLKRDIYCETAANDPNGMPSRAEADHAAALDRARQELNELKNDESPGVRRTAREVEDWIVQGNQSH